jgi:peptidyl-dipeptidase Dcp
MTSDKPPASDSNPLLEEWSTPFGVPPFDQIEADHYLPALREGMARHKAEIDEIADNPSEPTFANTLEALERSGSLLTRVGSVFGSVNSAHSNDVIRETARIVAPERAAHRDDITLNQALFERVEAVYEQRDTLDLDPEQRRLLEETRKNFVRAGANLDDGAQARLREINAELAGLSEEFEQNLLTETNDFELLVTERADLGALPDSLVAGAAAEAKRRGHDCECWAFTLQRPSINPFLEYSPNRKLRERIFVAYAMRGDNGNESDNNEILAQIAALRSERAC